MKVIVFGSINIDLVVTAPTLPQPGETLTGDRFFSAPGGKGANQAVAAARLGAETVLIGRVGGDSFAQPLRANLERNGVNIDGVYTDLGTSSGVALITVDESAENTIVIVAGANGRVGDDDLARLSDVIWSGDILLLQLEVPLEAVMAAAQVAKERGAMILLDPAPAQTLPAELIALVDMITPNETEAELLTGIAVIDNASAQLAIEALHQLGAAQVLLKMGGSGAWFSDRGMVQKIRSFEVNAIDTVAAGDACNGGIAAGLQSGLPLAEALVWGMAAGGLATTRHGAQEAMPSREQVLAQIAAQSA